MARVDLALVIKHQIKPGEAIGTCETCGCLLYLADKGGTSAAPHDCHAEAQRRAKTAKTIAEMEADAAYSPEISKKFGAILEEGFSALDVFHDRGNPDPEGSGGRECLVESEVYRPEVTEAQTKGHKKAVALYKKRAQVARKTGLCPECGRPIAFDVSPIAERSTQGGVCHKCGFRLWPRGLVP